jgi:hypothetical protein
VRHLVSLFLFGLGGYYLLGAIGILLLIAVVILLLPYELYRDRRRRRAQALARPIDNNIYDLPKLNARGFDPDGIPYL